LNFRASSAQSFGGNQVWGWGGNPKGRTRVMKFTAKRLLAAGAIGISAIVTPIALTAALPGVSNLPSSVAGAQGPFDQLTYSQSPSGSFTDQYLPAAGGGPGPQPVNISGPCATPTAPSPPGPGAALAMCGEVWPLSFTPAPTSTANVGANASQGPATGVAAITPAWTIDTKSNKGSESLDFSPGDPSIIGQSRAFTDAQIQVARKDTGNTGTTQVTVQLAEFSTLLPAQPNTSNLLGTQNCFINGQTGTQITVDPDQCTVSTPAPPGTATSANGAPLAFGTLEVRDATEGSTAIAVVGQTPSGQPTPATFELVHDACPGVPVPADSNGTGVSATLTLTGAANGPCKAYSSFIASPGQNNGPPTLAFNGFTTTNVRFTVQITWPAVPLCNPYVDDSPGNLANAGANTATGIPAAPGLVEGTFANECPIHQFSLDSQKFWDQAYCGNALPPTAAGAVPQDELCTVTKTYNNDQRSVEADGQAGPLIVNADGTLNPIMTTATPGNPSVPGTQITETWVGFVDTLWH
jgi:hypothetical protein